MILELVNSFLKFLLEAWKIWVNKSNKLEKPDEDKSQKQRAKQSFPVLPQTAFLNENKAFFEFGCYLDTIFLLAFAFKIVQTKRMKFFDAREINLLLNSSELKGVSKPNCFVSNPNALLKSLGVTRIKFVEEHFEPKRIPAKNEIVIGRFQKGKGDDALFHFAVMRDDLSVLFDPMENSKVIRDGFLESQRVFFFDSEDEAVATKALLEEMAS